MYVDNGKISSRQTFRLFVFDLMGIATLLLPPYLAKLCGSSGIWAIALGTGGGLLYLLYLGWVMKRMGTDFVHFLKENTRPWVRILILYVIIRHCVITAAFCTYIFTHLMQYSLVSDSSYLLIAGVIVLVAAYAVKGGIESRARVYEVLFWFVLIPYAVMMLASVRDFEPAYMGNWLPGDVAGVAKGTYLVFLFMMPLFFILFLIGEKEKKHGKSIVKTVAGSVLVAGLILLGSYVLLIGNFGEQALATMRFPVVTLMSTIQFEGTFLKRMDALMLAVWFFTLFALLNLHLHYAVRLVAELFRKKQQEGDGQVVLKAKIWHVILPALGVFGVACGMELLPEWKNFFLKYYSYVAVPLMVIGPGLLLLAGRRKNEK